MKSKLIAAKTAARRATLKRAAPAKVAAAKQASGGAAGGTSRRYEVYDTTVEPQHTTREQIAQAVALASSH